MDDYAPYRTFWRRFWAGWIDTALFLPLYWIDRAVWDSSLPVPLLLAWWVFYAVCFSVYSVLGHGFFGQTVGKRLMGVKVYDVGGGRLSMKQALLRDIVYIVLLAYPLVTDLPYVLQGRDPYDADRDIDLASWISIYGLMGWVVLEFVTMLFNRKRRALHDFIARSVVMRT